MYLYMNILSNKINQKQKLFLILLWLKTSKLITKFYKTLKSVFSKTKNKVFMTQKLTVIQKYESIIKIISFLYLRRIPKKNEVLKVNDDF